MKTAEITVLHQSETSPTRFTRVTENTHLEVVNTGTYPAPATDIHELLEQVFTYTQNDFADSPDNPFPGLQPENTRSLSMGDVVHITVDGLGAGYWVVAVVGFKRIDGALVLDAYDRNRGN